MTCGLCGKTILEDQHLYEDWRKRLDTGEVIRSQVCAVCWKLADKIFFLRLDKRLENL